MASVRTLVISSLCLLQLCFWQVQCGRGSYPGRYECSVNENDRDDCGFPGITFRGCRARGCCWRAARSPGNPWCYHSKSNSDPLCVEERESAREECGYPGISAQQCVDNDCCWRPTGTANIPWCYSPSAVYSGIHASGKSCGKPAIHAAASRIVGGTDASPHSWPWQVSIHTQRMGHECGASLIAPQWLLSAGHCENLLRYSGSTVRLGLHYSEMPDDETVEMEIKLADLYHHPDYQRKGRSILNDFLLIKLPQPVTFTDAISPICLPRPGDEMAPGTHCYATGWGKINVHQQADVLQQLVVPVLDSRKCNRHDWYDNCVTDDMICAGYEEGGRDACRGDSGGPLQCIDETGRWVLAGVTSWGWGCAKAHQPGVFAKVSHYIDWIETTMREHT